MKRPALKWLKAYTRSTFQHSGRKSLLLTGSKGCGKTTLLEALLEEDPLPGLRSCVRRGEDGLPVQVLLARRSGGAPLVIGRRQEGTGMHPEQAALDGPGAQWLEELRRAPGIWAAVDEIGFLESASIPYQRALWALFGKKRLLAVLRKADTPLLEALRGRSDCLVLDLDELPPPGEE